MQFQAQLVYHKLDLSNCLLRLRFRRCHYPRPPPLHFCAATTGLFSVSGMPSRIPPHKLDQSRSPSLRWVVLHAFIGTTEPLELPPGSRPSGFIRLYPTWLQGRVSCSTGRSVAYLDKSCTCWKLEERVFQDAPWKPVYATASLQTSSSNGYELFANIEPSICQQSPNVVCVTGLYRFGSRGRPWKTVPLPNSGKIKKAKPRMQVISATQSCFIPVSTSSAARFGELQHPVAVACETIAWGMIWPPGTRFTIPALPARLAPSMSGAESGAEMAELTMDGALA